MSGCDKGYGTVVCSAFCINITQIATDVLSDRVRTCKGSRLARYPFFLMFCARSTVDKVFPKSDADQEVIKITKSVKTIEKGGLRWPL